MPTAASSVTNSRCLQAQASRVADSRGHATVQVQVRLAPAGAASDWQAVGDVPAGASKGAHEAQTVPVPTALSNIETRLLPHLQGLAVDLLQPTAMAQLDTAMAQLAGDNFGALGANATLPLSRALWRLAAQLHGMSLAAYMRHVEPWLRQAPGVSATAPVRFFMNIFNGGLHALRPQQGEVLGRERISLQEIMVVPQNVTSYRQALAMGERIDAALKSLLQARYGAAQVQRADEAGFSVCGLGDDATAIAHVVQAVQDAGFTPGEHVQLAIDAAASTFYDAERQLYTLAGGSRDSAAMVQYWLTLVQRQRGLFCSIEDGLAENDWQGWQQLSAALQAEHVLTVGDDLFVTQLPRLQRGIAARSAHSILIKMNQNGTVHGTLQVMRLAQTAGMGCIVSHRSGETLDSSIADLAFASSAFGLKSGDPQPPVDFPAPHTWVRRNKYLRMIELAENNADAASADRTMS